MRTAGTLTSALVMIFVMSTIDTSATDQKFHLTILSSRPDMVSGGDALVQIHAPAGSSAKQIAIEINGRDVAAAFHSDPATHTWTGLVTELKPGENTLRVSDRKARDSAETLTLQNHPASGPIFSGPQEHPFICQTQDFYLPDGKSLGPPINADCSIKTVVTYVYKSTSSASASGATTPATGATPAPASTNLKLLPSLTELPNDVAWTTTTTGAKVPYVVRVETGTLNRAIYEFAVLSDPTKERHPDAFAPPVNWNRRLLYTFGGGCPGGWFKQGVTIGMDGVISDAIVGKGYAEASATLNVFGNNCNDVLAAETMMMVKERFIKAYGKPEFTMSRGRSGGSEQQIPIADNYPDLLDGIIPSLTFPDVLTNAQAIIESQLLNNYYAKSGDKLNESQKLAISGAVKLKDFSDEVGRINPSALCPSSLPPAEIFNPVSNRSGARCDVFDHAVNIYGRDPRTGFARRPVDNVGVQYGLAALNSGAITLEQFLDLNQNIGGYDNDGNPSTVRSVADPMALRAAYQSGRMVNGGLGLGKLPIIDVRPYRDTLPGGDMHQKFHSFSLRARLQKTNGNFDNEVMLVGPPPLTVQMGDYAIKEMDEWLTALGKDNSADPIQTKIARAKPTDLVDSCLTATGERIIEPQTSAGGRCNVLYKTSASPRMIAGGPASNDVLKCQLKPIDFADYQVTFNDADKTRLREIFPAGVCDWSKPGVEQQPTTGVWRSF
jgi:hypothetical protein